MSKTSQVVPFPLSAVDDGELRTRFWEMVYAGRRDSDEARALEAEIARRDRRQAGDSPTQ